jgi:hypothetical protein
MHWMTWDFSDLLLPPSSTSCSTVSVADVHENNTHKPCGQTKFLSHRTKHTNSFYNEFSHMTATKLLLPSHSYSLWEQQHPITGDDTSGIFRRPGTGMIVRNV